MAESNDNKYLIDFLKRTNRFNDVPKYSQHPGVFFFSTERGKLRIVSKLRFREHCKLSAVITEVRK